MPEPLLGRKATIIVYASGEETTIPARITGVGGPLVQLRDAMGGVYYRHRDHLVG